jgi:RNA polymerase sigma-70 factor (ECF subfamily)
MYGVCQGYCKNADEAKDLLQDGFVKVFSNIQNFKGDCPLEAWIRRIIVNTAIDNYRKSLRLLKTYDLTEAEEKDNDSVIPDGLENDYLLRIIHDLPEGYRLVFNLYVVEGYNHKEIADMLNISEGTSKSQLARARKNLQNRILRDNILTDYIKIYGKQVSTVV